VPGSVPAGLVVASRMLVLIAVVVIRNACVEVCVRMAGRGDLAAHALKVQLLGIFRAVLVPSGARCEALAITWSEPRRSPDVVWKRGHLRM